MSAPSRRAPESTTKGPLRDGTVPPRKGTDPGPHPDDGHEVLPDDDGLTAQAQIERRNEASRADADVLARHRQAAASRALVTLQRQIDRERGGPGPNPGDGGPTPTAEPGPAAQPMPTEELSPSTAPTTDAPATPLVIDLDHKGERLVILAGRIELRDRNDMVEAAVVDDEVVRVSLQRRLTGSVLVIEGHSGPLLVARGVRADYAEQAQALIVQRARTARGRTPHTPPAEAPTPAATAPTPKVTPADEVDLLRKLGDLHRAGVLTTEEYEEKIELVARLAGDDTDRTTAG